MAIPLAAVAARKSSRRARLLEQRASAAERLAELGTLTGGLAHEIKNPLSTVGLNVQLLREDLDGLAHDLPADDQIQDQIGRVCRRFDSLGREVDRLRSILEDFLRFAGRMKLDRLPVRVNAMVDELTDFFLPQAQAAKVHLRTQLSASPDQVYADADMLKQAVLNLMINATQTMTRAREKNSRHGGADELIIRTERGRTLGQDEVRIHVIDTGPGIEHGQFDKVFQPYYTTRKGGTGLGLPTARRIVLEHGGTLRFHSEPGRGTDFVLSLPVNPPADYNPAPQ